MKLPLIEAFPPFVVELMQTTSPAHNWSQLMPDPQLHPLGQMMNRYLLLTLWSSLTLAVFGNPVSAQQFPLRLPTPGGEVILPNAGAQAAHDRMRFATARRVGDTLYVSGVIIGRRPDEGRDAEAFRAQVRRGFANLRLTLDAACASFADVAKVTSFHVWNSPDFAGTRDEQFALFSEVLGEFIAPPYPAWTAVGTTGTLADSGIVEVELIAHVRGGQQCAR